MNISHLLTVTLTITLLAISTLAMAAAQISVETTIEKQERFEIDGKQQVRYVPAETTVPGDTLRFTLTYKNSGDEPAMDVVLDNPVPTGTSYLTDTATHTEATELLFSIDGGATYKNPTLLTYTVTLPNGGTESRVASPEQYTHVRWRISSIPPGETGQVSFNALVL
jgi:uncharacterized repeat protein (TIGR01451 family)